MLVEGVHQAKRRGVKKGAASRIEAVVRRAYHPLYADEIGVLRKIAKTKSFHGLDSGEREYGTRFLDAHLVLCYLNDDFWHDVHPLIRSEVVGDDG